MKFEKYKLNNIEKLGFDNWFKDKIDLSKTANSKITKRNEKYL